ncbi:MAG TPA: PspC domain-containing protein [Lachnospiraceae bacterium]|jgi:Putative stress-responsive transcriptional regulator|nr:PspC domain-containing protein [Lachnospiraceae bacterium]
MNKKLYRIEDGKKMSGVCAGIAEYFDIDVTLIRLLWVVLTFFTAAFPGIILYIACVFIIPEVPNYIDAEYKEK